MQRVSKFLAKFWPLLVILAFFAGMVIPQLTHYGFWDWDECIYTQYARTIGQTGNFMTHQWNGMPVVDKPPLIGNLIQIVSLGHVTETSARFTIVILSLLLLVGVYLFSKKYFSKRIAILSTLLLFAGNLFIIYGIRVNTDIGVALFVFLAVAFWIHSYSKQRSSYIAGLMFGLAVLSKGLSVGPYLVALFVSLFFLPKKKYFLNYLRMLCVLAAVILPWHLYEYLTYGHRFTDFYIYDNIIKRAKYPLEFHLEGRLFYLKLLLKEFFPWIAAAAIFPFLYWKKYKNFLKWKSLQKELSENRLIFTIVLLIIIPLVMITTIRTRIAWYALPIYPFLTIFLGYNLDMLIARLPFKKIIFAVLVFLIAIVGYRNLSGELNSQNPPAVVNRNILFQRSAAYPESSINYLVQFSERQANDILPPEQRTSITFIYGGNPCAVFYSGKKVNYYYSVDKFLQQVKANHGLYAIENGDLHFIKDLPVQTLYKNADFTLFKN